MSDKFKWFGDYGTYPVEDDGVYDEAYFEKYVAYSKTPLGLVLNAARLSLVDRHLPDGVVLDVGIGCGQFVEARNEGGKVLALGYDVNPAGVRWLRERGVYSNPYVSRTPAMSFWDSLEHLEQPGLVLERCMRYVFVSLPIFQSKEHALASKHFRPTEHWWYWTHAGFLRFMEKMGFALLEWNDQETELGREGIESFAFKRVV